MLADDSSPSQGAQEVENHVQLVVLPSPGTADGRIPQKKVWSWEWRTPFRSMINNWAQGV